jgi:hypothetical protein
MAQFQQWMAGRLQQGVVVKKSVTSGMSSWTAFVSEHQSTFALYDRYKVEQGIGDEPDDPYTLQETAEDPATPGTADQKLRQLMTGLDQYSAKVFAGAEAQWIADKNASFAHRQRAGQDEVGEAEDPGTCKVRLQVQSNFKMKKGEDTLSTRVVQGAGGVSMANLELAYAEIRAEINLNSKFLTQMDSAWESHKGSCEDYSVGKSYSVNFDDKKIQVGGRPAAGYRLDVENVRVAQDKRNFI